MPTPRTAARVDPGQLTDATQDMTRSFESPSPETRALSSSQAHTFPCVRDSSALQQTPERAPVSHLKHLVLRPQALVRIRTLCPPVPRLVPLEHVLIDIADGLALLLGPLLAEKAHAAWLERVLADELARVEPLARDLAVERELLPGGLLEQEDRVPVVRSAFLRVGWQVRERGGEGGGDGGLGRGERDVGAARRDRAGQRSASRAENSEGVTYTSQ